MACPLFLPASPLAGFADLFSGECDADAVRGECDADAVGIDADTLRRCCNPGYARGVCARAAQSEADAFRFLVKANHGGVIDVAWSSERDHHPVAVGTLAVDCGIEPAHTGPLERQARAWAAAYLRQIGA